MRDDLQAFFLEPKTTRQRQYEALRAYVLEGINAKEVGLRFGFTETSIYALAHDLRTRKLELFPKAIMGPKDRRVTPYVRHIIYELRKENLSTTDIIRRLRGQNVTISESTVERILKEGGFGKLQRRTASQRGVSTKRKGHQSLSDRLTKGSVLMSIKGSELSAMKKINKFKDVPQIPQMPD